MRCVADNYGGFDWGSPQHGGSGCARRVMIVCVVFTCALSLLIASSALAASGRKFARQITSPLSEPGGVAVDGSGDLWIADIPESSKLDEFGPASAGNQFLSEIKLFEDATFPFPESLAIEDSTGHFYLTGGKDRAGFKPRVEVFEGTGNIFKGWEAKRFEEQKLHGETENRRIFGEPAHVSVGGSSGSVYVAHGEANPEAPAGDGLPQGIEKFDASGEPVEFGAAKKCGEEKCGYIAGNEITGIPSVSFQGHGTSRAPGSMTVDVAGNIYVVDATYNESEPAKPQGAVVEFDSEGRFLRACTGEENPGLGEEHGGWGTGPEGLKAVAVDPITGHVLVAVTNTAQKLGVIDEFSSSCSYIGQITEGASGGNLSSAVTAMTFDVSGNLYVVEKSASNEKVIKEAVDVYEPQHFAPAVQLAAVSGRGSEKAVVNGSVDVNREGSKLEVCQFEYVTEEAFNQSIKEDKEGFADLTSGGKADCVPAASTIPADSNSHAVDATLTGLIAGKTYRFRLLATTEGSLGGTSVTESLAFTMPALPRIDSASVTDISSRFAALQAQIDPLGSETTYRFEYDTREYTSQEPHGVSVPIPSADIGSGGPTGGADVSVAQQINSLTPSTTYYFRVVATNKFGIAVGAICEDEFRPDCTFSTLSQTDEGLPDGRAYELLTPANKGSAEDMFAQPAPAHNSFENGDVGYPSDSGNEFLFETKAAFGPFAASGQNAYVFQRDNAGWQTLSLASESLGVQTVTPGVFDPSNFSKIGVFDRVGSKPSPAEIERISLLGPPGGGPAGRLYKTILSESEPTSESAGAPAMMVGASDDLGHVIVQTKAPTLLPQGQYQGSNVLYEWTNAGLTLASVSPDGSPFHCGALLGQSGLPGARHNAMSADGSRIFITAPDPYTEKPEVAKGCWDAATGENAPQLYMRFAGITGQISAPEAGVLEGGKLPREYPAIYVGASKDGSRAFFITQTELTQEAAKLGLHDEELYEYNVGTAKLTRISAGESETPEAHVLTVPAISADGSAVYFTAFGALAQGAQTFPNNGSTESVNLYRYDTAAKTITYVARAEKTDYPVKNQGGWWNTITAELIEEVALATNANWYATPDGRYLLFSTASELTGYNTAEAGSLDCPPVDIQGKPSGRCSEVYRYDSELPVSVGRLGVPNNPVCVSCDASGARPVSDAFFGHAAGPGAPAGGSVRAMSDDGLCVFFDTADPLVSQDSNGTNDVYEWEARGASGCVSSSGGSACQLAQGCVHLISSGEDSVPSFFLGASADGSNVFFGTHTRLVSQDVDNAGDLYDARMNGGFGVQGGVGPCEGDACQNPPPAPIEATPGSLTFAGPGNVTSEAVARTKSKVKRLTQAQLLSRALTACKKRQGKKRAVCERLARKRYGAKNRPKAKRASSPVGGGK